MFESTKIPKFQRKTPEGKEELSTEVTPTPEKAPRVLYERDKEFKDIAGTVFKKLGSDLICRTLNATSIKPEDAGEIACEALYELQPKDYAEGMLCSQLVALHMMGMRSLEMSMSSGSPRRDSDLNNAVKLLRLQHETLEALSRYRRKGEQKVVVQHVQVNDGGKAIVGGGDVVAGGGVQQ